jgi:hypothetical protein
VGIWWLNQELKHTHTHTQRWLIPKIMWRHCQVHKSRFIVNLYNIMPSYKWLHIRRLQPQKWKRRSNRLFIFKQTFSGKISESDETDAEEEYNAFDNHPCVIVESGHSEIASSHTSAPIKSKGCLIFCDCLFLILITQQRWLVFCLAKKGMCDR